MKAISYSLFGYDEPRYHNCYDFESYKRGVLVNLRMNRLLFPGWTMILNLDEQTYKSEYKSFFDKLEERFDFQKIIHPNNHLLCEKMLWRMYPVFEMDCSHVLCRDIDAVATYREAQAVAQWMEEDKTIHCITDSISHTIPMMGGMIGFIPKYLKERINIKRWDNLVMLWQGQQYNMAKKGADQRFLCDNIYPKCCDSATEHFVKGMRHNLKEEDGRHYSIDGGYPINVNPDLKASNEVVGHIGAAGYFPDKLEKFLLQFDEYKNEYEDLL